MEITQKEGKSKRLYEHNCTCSKTRKRSSLKDLLPWLLAPFHTLLQKLSYGGFRHKYDNGSFIPLSGHTKVMRRNLFLQVSERHDVF